MAKIRQRHGPNLPTVKKIKELVEYRVLHRKQMGRQPTWTSSCHRIGIGYRTVKRHALELIQKWYDKNFRW